MTNREEFSGVLTTLAQPLLELTREDGYAEFDRGLEQRVDGYSDPSGSDDDS